ncbi:MAG: hypothetical protein ACRDHP_06715 [Ktedonobacterales bacterium]
MSYVIELSDEQYARLEAAATKGGETPERLIERMVNALSETSGPVYYTDDELLRVLGADDAEIAELAALE